MLHLAKYQPKQSATKQCEKVKMFLLLIKQGNNN